MKFHSIAPIAVMLVASGCGASQTAPQESGRDDSVCREIGQACHEADSGEGEAHDCHASAHSTWSAAQCAEHREHCLSICGSHDPVPSGGEAPATSSEHGADHAGSTGS